MGIVIRQWFWTSFIAYTGVILGYVATIIVFPTYLDVDQIGLIRLIQSNGSMLIPVVTLGMPGTWIQRFPQIKNNKHQQSQLLSFQLLVVIVMSLIIGCIIFLLSDSIQSFFSEKSAKYNQYIYISFVILLTQGVFDVVTAYYRSQLNVATSGYFREIHLRVVNLFLVFLFGLGFIDFTDTINFIGLNYIVTCSLLIVVMQIKYRFWFTFNFLQIGSKTIKNLFYYGGYFTIIALGTSIMNNLGFLLTSTYLGLEANGIFATCLYIGMIIEMPKRASTQILSPLIAEYFNKSDRKKLNDLYYRSSINLALLSALLFIGIITNVDDLFNMIPKGDEFREGTNVIILIGISKVIAMTFGSSAELFTYSPYKRFNIYIMIVNSIVMIILSLTLIPNLGINGAAIAFLATATLNNLIRFYWIYTKLKLSPFRSNHLRLFIIIIILFAILLLIPLNFNPLINIIIRSIITVILFTSLIYVFNISDEVNHTIHRVISMRFLKK